VPPFSLPLATRVVHPFQRYESHGWYTITVQSHLTHRPVVLFAQRPKGESSPGFAIVVGSLLKLFRCNDGVFDSGGTLNGVYNSLKKNDFDDEDGRGA
jgi:hypothetical protein